MYQRMITKVSISYIQLRDGFRDEDYEDWDDWDDYDDVGDYGNYLNSFQEWDRNAQIDGWVCRADVDCEWIDENLGCDDYEFNIKDIQV